MAPQKINRRDFLKTAGITVGAATLLCGGLGYAATAAPAGVALPELSYGKEDNMEKRILVTYATKAGSTAEIAAKTGEILASRGFSVDVIPVKENPSLAGYQAVVIGSAIRIGKWLSEAEKFVRSNQAQLSRIPVALFSVHLENLGDGEAEQAARRAYTAPIRELLPQAQEAFFPGKIDYATLSFLDRTLAKAMAKQTGLAIGDFRDWDQVQDWSSSVFA